MDIQFQCVDGVKHVKVRVPVLVDATGRWHATSWHSWNKDEAQNHLVWEVDRNSFDHVRRIYWLYALVPVPDHDGYRVIGCDAESE